jgi:dCTP deaminase
MSLLVDHQIRAMCDESLWNRGYCLDHLIGGVGHDDFPKMIDPFSEAVSGGGAISYGLTHAGYDLRLGYSILRFKNYYGEVLDVRRLNEDGYNDRVYAHEISMDSFVIPPNHYVLGHSMEYLRIPKYVKGRCVGKSTLARLGILINTTPLEPGWEGHLTIEIGNVAQSPVRLRPGEGIAQLEFEVLRSNPSMTYSDKNGKYQGQTGVTPAKVI